MPRNQEIEPKQLEQRMLRKPTALGEILRNTVGSIIHRADISVVGAENLEKLQGSGAIVVIAPHNGHVDTLLVRNALEKAIRKSLFFLAAADYWHKAHIEEGTPFFKKLALHSLVAFRRYIVGPSFARIMPIDRYDTEQAFFDLEQAAERALNGEMPVIFPEGTRSRDGKKPMHERDFKTGLGLLVLMTEGKVPILPIYLEGNENLMPPEAKLAEFRKDGVPHSVTVHIGEPMNVSSLVQKPIDQMSKGEQRAFRRMTTSLVHGQFVGTYEDVNGGLRDTRPY